jgi:hypothetical protein
MALLDKPEMRSLVAEYARLRNHFSQYTQYYMPKIVALGQQYPELFDEETDRGRENVQMVLSFLRDPLDELRKGKVVSNRYREVYEDLLLQSVLYRNIR